MTGKSGTSQSGKSGTALGGKSSSLALGSKSSTAGSSGKKSSGLASSSSSKSYATPTYGSPKSNKSSMGFGIIWLPTKKRNKNKDAVYSPHQSDHPKDKFGRAPSMYNFMSGDSSEHQTLKKKEEETDLLVPDRAKLPIATAASASATVEAPSDISPSAKPDEKTEFIRRDKEDGKEAAGDTNEKDIKRDGDYLENDNLSKNSSEGKLGKEKHGDKVDSFFRPPTPHRALSNDSTPEDEDCGIKCLYYTLQCCECVVM